ncbi:hypothetical protein KDW_53460 [Dictyobacter vulcani]|uniref:Uncharacterized protein n=1 Tax=Dictyobacter vulcani TaxID=2607529 RepID=A0A5J4KP80_9CHLR|nr:hypothetical protein [Dictyobacter vulcani]GER91184.1 hypothetical protein KDW_53460 [Dictyobacter vulcani]
MQTPNQGRDNNPNQNQWNPNQPDQDPYRQAGMNPPGQVPYRQEGAPEQVPYQQTAMNPPGQEPYRQGTIPNRPDQRSASTGNVMPEAPITGYTVPSGYPFSQQEWQTLLAAPMQVSVAMMSASPSGIIGIVQEAMAIGKSVQTLQSQGTTSRMLGQLGQQLTKGIEDLRAGRQTPIGDIQQMAKHTDMARNSALAYCQQAAGILDKVSPQDASVYKQFVYSMAYNVAAAAREGGFLGLFGGEQVSPVEQAFLGDIASALRLQRS